MRATAFRLSARTFDSPIPSPPFSMGAWTGRLVPKGRRYKLGQMTGEEWNRKEVPFFVRNFRYLPSEHGVEQNILFPRCKNV